MTEKDGLIYPGFTPNENPFVIEKTKGDRAKNKAKESNDIFDDDDGGDYYSLYWNE